MNRCDVSTPAADTVHVQAHGARVQSLHERGVTWVSFKPMPDLACAYRLQRFGNFPTSACYRERCRVSATNMPAETAATATTISAFI